MQKIMFNDKYGLTNAVLEGRKTMTRRVIKAPRTMEGKDVYGLYIVKDRTGDVVEVTAIDEDGATIGNILPKYKVGEVAAVAQPYKDVIDTGGCPQPLVAKPGWSNKMFVRADLMPHQIRITNVRVERLQDISDEDCIKEGIDRDREVYAFNDYEGYRTPRLAFAALINRTSGNGTWESNPWVFCYEFELVK